MRTSPTTTAEGPEVQGPVATRGPDPIQEIARRYWVNHPSVDWAGAVVIGAGLNRWVVHRLPFDELDGSIRFAFYAGLAGAALAFLTVAFTPLAIMVTLGEGAEVRRLRAHDPVIRRQFLLGSLVLFGGALVLFTAGTADATTTGSSTARLVGTLVVGLVIAKALRMTQLFWAILAAGQARK